MVRKGYLLVGNNSYYVAEKYVEPKDIAIVDAFYLVVIIDSISEEERKKLLIEAIKVGLETVPVEVEVPEKYSYTRYGFQLDPVMIQIRKGIMPRGTTKELGSSEH
ncbi:MAG TPA: hypothetical protein VNN20_08275 [Thermodesulfobacteriota bacterium]|nr:hypothetical protein [Thermodesulfobacteriota bacterium]